MRFEGRVHVVGDHIDTDAIIPARFLVTADPLELGKNCMEGLAPRWIERVRPGDILVAGENFGCGSSREHAPLAILGAGIPVVLAKSFARIFYRNGFNMGLPLVEMGEAISCLEDGHQVVVDITHGVVTNQTTGQHVQVRPIPAFMMEMLQSGGLVGYVRKRLGGAA